MDKIEKLELKNDLITLEVDRIAMKINEIIDVLNSQLFEPKILNYPTDQSQKQPEGEITSVCDKHHLKVCKECEEGYNLRTFLPEKQEEWIDGLARVMEDVYVFEDVVDYISQLLSEEFEKGVIKGRLEALPITRELLSERTFTKEELFMLKLATNEIHNKGNNAYDEIGDKISKLLELKEEE
jgi:hypothetical protein